RPWIALSDRSAERELKQDPGRKPRCAGARAELGYDAGRAGVLSYSAFTRRAGVGRAGRRGVDIRAFGLGQQSEAVGSDREVRERTRAELLQHVAPVEFDGPLGDSQRVGDLLVQLATRQKREDVGFPRGEPRHDRPQGGDPAVLLARLLALQERTLDGF